jgi:hypothetical protein
MVTTEDINNEMRRIEKCKEEDPERYELTSALVKAESNANSHYNDSRFKVAERTLEELNKLGYTITKKS